LNHGFRVRFVLPAIGNHENFGDGERKMRHCRQKIRLRRAVVGRI
jgi:hypothetical protein